MQPKRLQAGRRSTTPEGAVGGDAVDAVGTIEMDARAVAIDNNPGKVWKFVSAPSAPARVRANTMLPVPFEDHVTEGEQLGFSMGPMAAKLTLNCADGEVMEPP
jgi:hypothetical protein